MIKAVIFDLDGTLCNTLEDLADSVNAALKAYGFKTHPYSAYPAMIGGGFYKLIKNSLKEAATKENIDKVYQAFLNYYAQNYLTKTKDYPGIKEVLAVLIAEGYSVSINSNKREDYTLNIVRTLLPTVHFNYIYGQRAGMGKKPDPFAAKEIARLLALKTNEVLYVGDSEVDLETAANAKMPALAVTWGFRSKECLAANGAELIAETPQDILTILQQLNNRE